MSRKQGDWSIYWTSTYKFVRSSLNLKFIRYEIHLDFHQWSHTWIFFLKKQSETLARFKILHKQIELQFGYQIKQLWSNGVKRMYLMFSHNSCMRKDWNTKNSDSQTTPKWCGWRGKKHLFLNWLDHWLLESVSHSSLERSNKIRIFICLISLLLVQIRAELHPVCTTPPMYSEHRLSHNPRLLNVHSRDS